MFSSGVIFVAMHIMYGYNISMHDLASSDDVDHDEVDPEACVEQLTRHNH